MSDGCSGGISKLWRWVTGDPPPFEGCCITHDRAYAVGGSRRTRLAADRALFRCVWGHGNYLWAVVMYVGVRLFGGPYWPRSKRWGYETDGYHPIRGYSRFGTEDIRKEDV